jgi:diamine N-acetyltransferase
MPGSGAIYAGYTPVGFVMISDIIKKADYFLLWFMIDARYQRSNFGRRVTELLINHVRTRPNAEELYVSYHGGEGGPEGFYQRFEFEPTGEIEDGEIIAKMKL